MLMEESCHPPPRGCDFAHGPMFDTEPAAVDLFVPEFFQPSGFFANGVWYQICPPFTLMPLPRLIRRYSFLPGSMGSGARYL
jgi:hypothetical protein